MKKKELKKLSLSRETLVQLTGQELKHPAGGSGGWSDGSVCPSVTPSACKPCN